MDATFGEPLGGLDPEFFDQAVQRRVIVHPPAGKVSPRLIEVGFEGHSLGGQLETERVERRSVDRDRLGVVRGNEGGQDPAIPGEEFVAGRHAGNTRPTHEPTGAVRCRGYRSSHGVRTSRTDRHARLGALPRMYELRHPRLEAVGAR